jgi:hypothetical protein
MNVNVAIQNGFRPFSFDELVKPLLLYQQAYDKAEEAYSKLSEDTEAWADIATKENSPEAYAMYKKYSNDLSYVTDDFSKGMTAANRRALLKMKRRYSKEIKPIEQAAAAMKEANTYRETVLSKDNSAIFKVDRYDSVDSFLHGKTADNSYVSGDKILARTASKAEAIGKAMFSDPKITQILNGQKYQLMQAQGVSPEELFLVLSRDPAAQPYLSQIYDEEWKAVNGDSYSEQGKAQIRDAITTGMYAALAKPTYNYIENGEYQTAYQRNSLAIQRESNSIQKEQYTLQNELKKIAAGQLPYATDGDKTGYFSDGTFEWEATKQDDGTWKLNPGTKHLIKKGSDGDEFAITQDEDGNILYMGKPISGDNKDKSANIEEAEE